ncbi:MAG: aldo/keto reductase [Planctomycetota bacterium]
MRYRTLGHSGLQVSEIGFGCSALGGPAFSSESGHAIGRAPLDEDAALDGLRIALEAGVNHFDNADIYGYGRAERLLGRGLSEFGHLSGPNRDRLVIASKVGHHRGTAPHAFTPFNIRRQCEQSLTNLGLDHIDLYYLHHAGFAPDDQPGNLTDAAGTMHELLAEGKIRAIGQSGYTIEDFERTVPVLRPAAAQSWGSMIRTAFIERAGPLASLLAAHDCSFIAFSPLGQGLLLDKFDPDNPPQFDDGDLRRNIPMFSHEQLTALKPKLEALKERFGGTVEDLASAACRYVLAHDHVAGVIPGFRNESQARCNLRAATDDPFTSEDLAFCRELFGTD